ncbi:unnamed protein product, partial [Allacma fusca]
MPIDFDLLTPDAVAAVEEVANLDTQGIPIQDEANANVNSVSNNSDGEVAGPSWRVGSRRGREQIGNGFATENV